MHIGATDAVELDTENDSRSIDNHYTVDTVADRNHQSRDPQRLPPLTLFSTSSPTFTSHSTKPHNMGIGTKRRKNRTHLKGPAKGETEVSWVARTSHQILR